MCQRSEGGDASTFYQVAAVVEDLDVNTEGPYLEILEYESK